MEREQIIEIIISCLKEVHERDALLFTLGVDERAINHRLALYLSPYFENESINVDVEYNRHLTKLKYYEENKYGSIDIVIHERGFDRNNICAIECKKETLNEIDLRKLRALVSDEFIYSCSIGIEYNTRTLTIFELNNDNIEFKRQKY